MTKSYDREKALELRKQGLSYSFTKNTLSVSKGTLSIWLREYPLSRERINELRANSEKRIERFRETMKKKRENRCAEVYQKQKGELLPLTKKIIYCRTFPVFRSRGKDKAGRSFVIKYQSDYYKILYILDYRNLRST